ncbi:unnamed protein product [Rhizophagus irregularis]|nr:unnamed protein product [Rhizophagus irregularis]
MMETLQEDEYDGYIAKFSRNIAFLDDTDNDIVDNINETDDNINENDDNINETEEIEDVRGRGRGRGRSRGRGRGRGRGSRGRGGSNRGRGNISSNEQVVQLPSPPIFNKFQHSKPLHEFTTTLPRELLSPSPYSIFCLFFSLEQVKTIVKNTNIYAYVKNAGEGRKWKDLTIKEFWIWLAILIYSGIYKLPSIEDYWNRDSRYPEHKISTFMTLLHFEQIKRFIHISDCTVTPTFWYFKLNPLMTHIQAVSKSICIPSSNVSVDEMIAKNSKSI